MNTAHTPGPWIATKKEYGPYTEWMIQTVAADHIKTYIGEVGGGLQDDNEIRANAELIASAPQMLAELEQLRAEKERLIEGMKKINMHLGLPESAGWGLTVNAIEGLKNEIK